jgi:hypothetical protein
MKIKFTIIIPNLKKPRIWIFLCLLLKHETIYIISNERLEDEVTNL